METKTQIEIGEIIEFLTSLLGLNDSKKKLTKTTDMMSELGLDIIDVVEVIMELENKFEIKIKDDDIFRTEDSLKFTPTPEILTNIVNNYLEKMETT